MLLFLQIISHAFTYISNPSNFCLFHLTQAVRGLVQSIMKTHHLLFHLYYRVYIYLAARSSRNFVQDLSIN